MLRIEKILARSIGSTTKGVPAGFESESAKTVTSRCWNVLNEDIPFPLAVLRSSSLENNLRWMQRYVNERGLMFAPHGKTTMSPQLWNMQIESGAWGVTIATGHQLRVCRQFGVGRVMFANQLYGKGDIAFVSDELSRDDDFEFYCLVDSIDGVERLGRELRLPRGRQVSVLIELGIAGGRTGCRHLQDVLAIANAVTKERNLSLRGVECYEGIYVSEDLSRDLEKIDTLVEYFLNAYESLLNDNLFEQDQTVILSAGGSAYFDIIAGLQTRISDGRTKILLRSGCYLTHDSLFYAKMMRRFDARISSDGCMSGLRPALEVWGQIQSVPEPGLAFANVGKRDISHDIDLPVVQKRYCAGDTAPVAVSESWRVEALNDQHARLVMPIEETPGVGELISFGISHPCTTFDKWQLLWVVNDDYQIESAVWTYF